MHTCRGCVKEEVKLDFGDVVLWDADFGKDVMQVHIDELLESAFNILGVVVCVARLRREGGGWHF